MFANRAEIQINLNAIKHNYNYIKQKVDSSNIIAVVKADAYGHGATEVSHALEEIGCRMFAVASVEEGRQLRNSGIKGDILILGLTPVSQISEVIAFDLIQAVNSYEYAKQLSMLGKVRVHIKIDTGMSRLGIYCHGSGFSDAVNEIAGISGLANISCEGIFTHFVSSDGTDEESIKATESQFSFFSDLCNECEKNGIKLGMRHICNSGGILNYPHMKLDAVRAGIILYGLMPDGSPSSDLVPAMSLFTHIVQITHLKKGDFVSYGQTFTAERDMYAATLSIGYADGYFRSLSGKACVMLHGKRVPVIGRICMDMCMVDVTDIFSECKVGDEAEIFGTSISANELASLAGTINYEIICSVKSRVVKKYNF